MARINEAYWNLAMSIKKKLKEEINGLVRFEIYEPIDAIIFRINFKEFDFNYGINNIQDIIYDGVSSDIADEILSKYKKTILNSFFKSDDRKRRDENMRLGIKEDDFV